MSTSGLSAKSHGDKSSASGGKKFQAVNINSVYSGKSLVGQKSANAGAKHGGLQSLGKATAVARRMPPPANLPSLKSESAGQDPAVNIVPSGVAGWGNQGQQQTTPPQQDHQQAKSFFDTTNKKAPSDGISLRPSGGGGATTAAGGKSGQVSTSPTTVAGAHSPGAVSPGGNAVTSPVVQPTSNRQTWSTRIGTNSGGSFFASQAVQDYPKLHNETESSADGKTGTGAPSLRPQKSGTWKSGGGQNARSAQNESPPSSPNDHVRSRSSSPSMSDRQPLQPPFNRQQPMTGPPPGSRQPNVRHGAPVGPPPNSQMLSHHSSALYPPPPHPHGRDGGGPQISYAPHVPPPYLPDFRHPSSYGHPPQQMMPHPRGPGPGRYGNAPPPHDGRNVGAPSQQHRGGNDASMQQQPPQGYGQPAPPEHYRGGPGAMQPPLRARNSGDYGHPPYPPPGRGGQQHGDMDSHPQGRGEQWNAGYRPREADPRYRENVVWSDDEGDDRGDRRYARGNNMRGKSEKHALSDSEDRYQEDWSGYDESRRPPPRGYPPQPPPNMGPYPPNANAAPYGPPVGSMGPPMPGRDNRFHHMQMPMPHGYNNYMPPYDPRRMQQGPPMNYGQPHGYVRSHPHPQDIEAEEQEEMARQEQQQYARDAAIERSKQKRLHGQMSSVSSGGTSEHISGDNRYVSTADAPQNEEYDDSEPDRSSSRESHGAKPVGNRRQNVVAPRFIRQGGNDARPAQPMPQAQNYGYGGPPQPFYQHPSSGGRNQGRQQYGPQGQGDSSTYYGKHAPQQGAGNVQPYSGAYENRRYDESRYRDKNTDQDAPAISDTHSDQFEKDAQFPNESRYEKPLKRPDSKESLSSRSDKSNSKNEKNTSANNAPNRNRKWATDSQTVKEEESEYQTRKSKTYEEDIEEEQKFETLTKPSKVVKRSAPPPASSTVSDKPKPQQPTSTGVESTAQDSKNLQKSPGTVQPPATGNSNPEATKTNNDVPKSEIKNQSIAQHASKDSQQQMIEKKNVWEQRRQQFDSRPPTKDGTENSMDTSKNAEQDEDYENFGTYGRGGSRSRGTGGRAVREFVSSRRAHGHSLGNSRRGRGIGGFGSVSEHHGSSNRPHQAHRRGGSARDYADDKNATHSLSGAKRTFEATREGSTENTTKDESNTARNVAEENRESSESTVSGQQQQRGGHAARGRGRPRGTRGGRSGNDGYYYSSSHQTDDWNNGNGSTYSRGRGGRGYRYSGDGYEGYDDTGDTYDRNNRGGVRNYHPAPRFQQDTEHGGSSTNAYRRPQGRGRGGYGHHRGNLAAMAKSPTGQRENQSEGNDEWETASESSDIGERHKPDRDGDLGDKKRQSSSGPKSFSSQRRGADRRRGTHGGQNVYPNGGNRRGGGDKECAVESGQCDSQFFQTAEQNGAGQNAQSLSKNVKVASHQASSGVTYATSTAENTTQNINNKSMKKDEKPAPKPGALATVDTSNIAGVVFIDNQPDGVTESENQDGFQEVVSKKRIKKETQYADEKDRKSQSPSSRMQSRSGSIGNNKNDKNGKKQPTAAGSIANNVSSRSSTDSASGGLVAPPPAVNPWGQKSNSNSGGGMTFTNRSVHNSQEYHHFMTGSNPGLTNASESTGSSSIPSKTGVEIWGTPDPVPFTGANEQQSINKCVSRPSNTQFSDNNAQPKSVEFLADSLNKGGDDTNVKLDFTFDASLGPFRDQKENASDSQDRRSGNDSDDDSPSAEQLSEKIASVKKVWDEGAAGNVLSKKEPSSAMMGQQAGGGSFFAATDAETAAIVSSAASMVSAAVLQLQPHSTGFNNVTASKTNEVSSTGASMTVLAAPSAGSSSKTEGPNVAKVRPQQILLDPMHADTSHVLLSGGDGFGGMAINAAFPPVSSSTLYAFTGGNSTSFFSPHFTPASKPDAFALPAAYASAARPPLLATGAPFGQTMVLPATAAMVTSQPMDLAFSNRTHYGGEQNILFGSTASYVQQQPLRNQPTFAGQPQTKSVPPPFGAQQAPLLFSENVAPISFLNHPPPPVNAQARPPAPVQTSQHQGVGAQQPPPNFYFPPPPMTQSVFTAAPTQMQVQQQSKNVPAYGWNSFGPKTGPMQTAGSKMFNPTIGPPNANQKLPAAPATSAPLPPHLGHNLLISPPPAMVPLHVTTPNQHGNFGNRKNSAQKPATGPSGVGGGPGPAPGPAPIHPDQAKRDGDLLQQMDKFINATSGDEEAANVDENTTAAYQSVN